MEHWANRETNPTERSKVNERFRFRALVSLILAFKTRFNFDIDEIWEYRFQCTNLYEFIGGGGRKELLNFFKEIKI